MKKGGVDVIITAMRQHASVADVQQNGCRALMNLASNAENKVTLRERSEKSISLKSSFANVLRI